MTLWQSILDKLWAGYRKTNPGVTQIFDALVSEGEEVINDHIALRTFNHPRVNHEVLAQPFLDCGYEPCDEYHFPTKRLYARHYEHPEEVDAPKVFISELLVSSFSHDLQETVNACVEAIDQDTLNDPETLLMSEVAWGPVSYKTYQALLAESEYAAWLYAFGYRANHFTVFVNALNKYNSIEKINDFVTELGYSLNTSGGVIKGTPEALLEQSSTLAEEVEVSFEEGVERIPACYYEFARRYPDKQGKLYSGFVAASADKIFESTDTKAS